ncbi:MAG: hypothetical protein BWY63_03450 [Chloroflexi bacterium ADurb.Bin360]|nr:MAG: hypothetical protein BWY63_03450 [Chloroflexi bacterium ADurb.Bin360]
MQFRTGSRVEPTHTKSPTGGAISDVEIGDLSRGHRIGHAHDPVTHHHASGAIDPDVVHRRATVGICGAFTANLVPIRRHRVLPTRARCHARQCDGVAHATGGSGDAHGKVIRRVEPKHGAPDIGRMWREPRHIEQMVEETRWQRILEVTRVAT